jgi:hypothetical protein
LLIVTSKKNFPFFSINILKTSFLSLLLIQTKEIWFPFFSSSLLSPV